MATGWNITDALNARTAAAAAGNRPKARFRTKDISIKRMYSNKRNFYSMPRHRTAGAGNLCSRTA